MRPTWKRREARSLVLWGRLNEPHRLAMCRSRRVGGAVAMVAIEVRLDRLQIIPPVTSNQKPPPVRGFRKTRDSFVRPQTTTATYARCAQYHSMTNDTKVYWQYGPLKGWLKPWKITLVADDNTGL